ncbi:hypothetical protein LCGC14_3095100, partial [marine sediment metagenome]
SDTGVKVRGPSAGLYALSTPCIGDDAVEGRHL